MEQATVQKDVIRAPVVVTDAASVMVVGRDQRQAMACRDVFDVGVPNWAITTATTADVLHEPGERRDYDIILIDSADQSADMLGLLELVAREFPSSIRIVLGDPALGPLDLPIINAAHQVLARDEAGDVLAKAISRVLSLRRLLEAEQTNSAVCSIDLLPVLPHVYLEFVRAAQTDGIELHVLAGIIEQDVALSAKVLQLVNSAFFGLRTEVKTLEHAVSVLGLEMVSALVTTTTAFSTLSDRETIRFAEALWIHSRQVGDLAERFLSAETDDSLHVEAIQSSLLHDIGRLVIHHCMPRSARIIDDLVGRDGADPRRAEQAIVGGTHEQIGAYLLSLWGIPATTVDVVLSHHDLEAAAGSGNKVLTAVAVANCLVPSDGDYSQEGVERRANDANLNGFFAQTQVGAWVEQAIALMNE